jgi:1,2-diacylglycerol 3-alpha-glucosyltransferase
MEDHGRQIRVLIACPGLGLSLRGFERVARDTFGALTGQPDIDIWLAKGRGPSTGHDRTAPTVSRDSAVARALSRGLHEHDFWIEQVAFSMTLQPLLWRLRPDVVMLSEWTLAGNLGRLRNLTRHRFRILLCNGAPGSPPFPPGVDHVQQVSDPLAEAALDAGFPAERQTMLPHGVRIPTSFEPPSDEELATLRTRLGLPVDRSVLLSVGAINIWHKRLDYLIRELASLEPESRPHLVMLGARETETDAVLRLANSLLGPANFTARTVPEDEVSDYYRSADALALASGFEGFGLALAEALGHGLPVLAHDTPVTRFVLGVHGYLADFAEAGALAQTLAGLDESDGVRARGVERHRSAYERFSWEILTPRYVEMLKWAAGAAPARRR